MTCLDNPYWSCGALHFPVVTGYDPEPGDMALIPQNNVVQEVANQIASFSEMNIQPRLWADNPYSDGDPYRFYVTPVVSETFFWYMKDIASYRRNLFITALQNGTTTGLLREHAMRLNSSVKCSQVPRSDFPPICPGAHPFTTSFSQSSFLDIRVCVPGEYGVYPWDLIRH